MNGGPFKLPTKENADAAKKKREAIARIKKWVESRIPDKHIKDRTCVVDVSEIVCGDPDCAPIDTAVRIIYEGKAEGPVGTAFAFPCEAVELTREALDERMPPASTFEDWYEGKPTHWPPPPDDVTLRFELGARVECKVGKKEWAAGEVTMLWFRQGDWPPGTFAPYQVQLDDGRLIFAPDDANKCIRAEVSRKGWCCLGG